MRKASLPTGPATGRLIVAESVLTPTVAALQASSGSHRPHEGLVFWLGRNVGPDTLVCSVAVPPTDNRPGGVFVNERTVAAISRAAARAGLGLVAQVHSHPGTDTRHSDGDDQLILMPYEGMFSLIVASYGHGSLMPDQGCGLHQFQNGRWTYVTDDAFMVAASVISVGETR